MGAKNKVKTPGAAVASTTPVLPADQFGPPGSRCAKYIEADIMKEVNYVNALFIK